MPKSTHNPTSNSAARSAKKSPKRSNPSSKKSPPSELSPFGQTLQVALNNFNRSELLAESPLASPLILGSYFSSDDASVNDRASALKGFLREATAQISGANAGRYQEIIKYNYFEGLNTSRSAEKVHLKRTQYTVNRKDAIHALEQVIIRLLKPAIQLETPLSIPVQLYGRKHEIERCQKVLANRQTLSVGGHGGIGKSTLGSWLAANWQQGPVFWHTVRPGWNDHPNSLLFAIGYFLHSHGQSNLWLELVAQNGALEVERALDILRHAFQQLGGDGRRPLICIDEVDLLQPSGNQAHSEISRLLQSLTGQVAILLIGQQPMLYSDHFIILEGLSLSECSQILEDRQHSVTFQEVQQIHQYTGGNPRLLDLLIALLTAGEKLSELIESLPSMPPLEFLFARMLQRLSDWERSILLEIAIFQRPVPTDQWLHGESGFALQNLHNRRLLYSDDKGQVSLLPAYQETLLRNTAGSKVEALHQQAADYFCARAQYTLAAFHLVQTAEPEHAVTLWRNFQQQEIEQGQAGSALTIFRPLLTQTLPSETLDEARLLVGTLTRLLGDNQRAIEDIRSITDRTPLLSIDRDQLLGELANDESEFADASGYFHKSMSKAESLVELRLVHCHKGLAWMHKEEWDLKAAQHEIILAKYEAENLQGFIHEMNCHYEDAENSYNAALSLAEDIEHKGGQAKTSLNLAGLLARLGKFDDAKGHHHQAEQAYKQIGNTVSIAGALINRGFTANLAGNHQDAIDAYHEAMDVLTQFDTAVPPWPQTIIHHGLAEAYLGLSNLDDAEAFVEKAIASEDRRILPDAYRTRGEILHKRNQLDDAIIWIRASIDLINQNDSGDEYLEGFAWRALACVYQERNSFEAADEAQMKAIDLFEQIGISYEVNRTKSIFPS